MVERPIKATEANCWTNWTTEIGPQKPIVGPFCNTGQSILCGQVPSHNRLKNALKLPHKTNLIEYRTVLVELPIEFCEPNQAKNQTVTNNDWKRTQKHSFCQNKNELQNKQYEIQADLIGQPRIDAIQNQMNLANGDIAKMTRASTKLAEQIEKYATQIDEIRAQDRPQAE